MQWVRKKRAKYSVNESRIRHQRRFWYVLPAIAIIVVAAAVGYRILSPAEATVEQNVEKLQFDSSVSKGEQETIAKALSEQNIPLDSSATISIATTLDGGTKDHAIQAYVPITAYYATRQSITLDELRSSSVMIPSDISPQERTGIAEALNIDESNFRDIESTDEVSTTDIAIIPVDDLTSTVKLLQFDDSYYLDSFDTGAIVRSAVFEGDNVKGISAVKLNTLPGDDSVLKVNQTGVTALTRLMMRKLNQVGSPTYFSQYIGDFLSDADITHVSNESSFKEGCTYSNTVLCSDPRFIETLKASGVDLVELTGNHNNDVGSQYNTESINQYHGLGWNTFGGGLNKQEAAQGYVTDAEGTRLAFLGYNYADSPNGGAIAGTSTAGANSFDFNKIENDIKSAKQNADYVIVDVQFWECYAYPDGYVEFPECDVPIGDQKPVFRKIAELGANMVVGTQAHQPQTYELYNNTPIYYGLGNLYFDQTQWPGTERGIVLTHYFVGGSLLQTKLTPTVYDTALQTRLMTSDEADYLLGRLQDARAAL